MEFWVSWLVGLKKGMLGVLGSGHWGIGVSISGSGVKQSPLFVDLKLLTRGSNTCINQPLCHAFSELRCAVQLICVVELCQEERCLVGVVISFLSHLF